jgi:NADH:ubiquinone oxidoreductase subunit E
MRVTICVGSSCHLKGSRRVVEQLQALIEAGNLKEKVELSGSFCMGNCVNGVSVKIDDKQFSLRPENIKPFFNDEILKGISGA